MIQSDDNTRSVSLQSTGTIGPDEFARMMNGINFFESTPIVAVGVSGGADSMALALLSDAWARSLGGRVIALTVDHGLRQESGVEAEWVAGELRRHGIDHHILPWQGDKPDSGIQDKARQVRRQLMLDWCREQGVLHLCLGHHANDQVETHLMRLARQEGDEEGLGREQTGLAGMSLIREHASARIIRPLLSIGKDRLEATLLVLGHTWIKDPSNENPKFERVRVRQAVSTLGTVGGGVSAMAESIRHYGNERKDLETLGAQTLTVCSALYPAGYAMLDLRTLGANGDIAARYALQRMIMAIGGRRYPVAREKLEQAHKVMLKWQSKGRYTVGGCLFTNTDSGVLISREERNLPEERTITHDQSIHWDNRFALSLSCAGHQPEKALSLGKLGRQGYDRLVQVMPSLRHHPVPLAARFSLPALSRNGEIISVAHLTNHYAKSHHNSIGFEKAAFSPPEPALGGMFSVALTDLCTISGTTDSLPEMDERNDA